MYCGILYCNVLWYPVLCSGVERSYIEEQRQKKQALYQELTQQMRKAQAVSVCEHKWSW